MPRLAAGRQAWPLQLTTFSCGTFEDLEPRGLGLTYWFDAAPDGEPYPVAIRFTGHRLGEPGKPGPHDNFTVHGTVDPVIPGSGRIALTARVLDIAPGEWRVSAKSVDPSQVPGGGARAGARAARRKALPPGSSSGTTVFAPVVRVRAPGVRLGAWPAFVSAGAAVALIVQALLAATRQLPVSTILLISLVACVAGLAGAKLYYLATHRGQERSLLTTGMSVQGFVLAAVGTAVLSALVAGVPVGQLLDVTAPGLLFGMTIGRFGCFFGGCCAGRPTASRWGLWSSDRRLGVRRIPVQLLESALAGVLGLVALLAVVSATPPVGGVVFVAAIAAYTFGRQVLFPIRSIARTTTHGRTITMVAAGLAVAAAVAVAVVA